MAARRHQHSRLIIEVDEYSSNPTQAFTFYNINQGRFQPPHVQIGLPGNLVLLLKKQRCFPKGMGGSAVCTSGLVEGSLPYEYKIVIAGNHELTFDQEFMADLIKQDFYYFPSVSKLKPENYENRGAERKQVARLEYPLFFVGEDNKPPPYGWLREAGRSALLPAARRVPLGLACPSPASASVDTVLEAIPSMSGFLDWVPKKMQRVGCVELLNTVQRRVQPRLHVFGHIHEGYGVMADGTTTYVNASVCTVNYQPVNPPIVIDLPTPRNS
ncbi:metallophosphoesterase domain-containing protein 1 [Pteropus vampyrus]|uniref:Metallophosphoesterase domain-containing protein 1 n=1 Tax=Pteropus vampyrus TaxID=132908 RepID=A0A6P3QWH2_PTEVA|nr:metallophosphoesterase domain-containing protein 1 [Pteropus vampyrus]